MSLVLRFQSFPRMWDRLSIATGAGKGEGATLRLGDKHIRLADVRAVERSDHAERDYQGVLVMGCVFTFAAALLMIGVFDFGMRQRFLLGALIFLVLGLVSLYEAATSTTLRFVRLRIKTASGETLFTTADPADAKALEMALGQQRT